ncbi:hypothetical protein P885DRAFT_69152 [Corynascus similis CBS 632.67]
MLASLLRQLASKCQGFRDEKSLPAFRGYQDDGELPTDTKDLLIYLRRFISRIDKDVFLVFDGIDQVPERQGTRDSDLKLLDIIKSLAHKGYPNLHILVVSRDEKDIRSYFEKYMQEMLVSVDVNQGLGEALNTLINRKLEGQAMTTMLKGDQDLKERIKRRLRQDGQASNSLWASSVLRQVFQCRDVKEIEQALGMIPDNINDRYQKALSKVADKDKDRMKSILLWLRWRERPLSQAEFVAAADLPNPAAVTEICSRVLVETAKEFFRFTHFSVREYLDDVFAKEPEALNKSSKVARFVPRPGEDAHLQITRRCLAVLLACKMSWKTKTNATARTGSDTDWDHGAGATSDSDDASQHTGTSDNDTDANDVGRADTDSEEDRQSTSTGSSMAYGGCPEGPARKYAAEYWFRHYAKINREKVSNESPSQLDDLDNEICSQVMGDANKMRFWLRTNDPDGGMNETIPSPVYYAVKLNLGEIFMRLITQIAQLPADATDRRVALLDQPGAEGTALQLATHQGNSKCFEELIKNKANVNSEKGPHGTALYASAARGDKDAVEKLLRAGAKLDGEDHGDLGSPLHVAAFRGHDAVVELLLEGGLAVDQRASPFGTALQAASAARQFSTVKLLLDKKADPNIVGGCLGTAAQAAFAHDEGPLSSRDTVIGELRLREAQFLDTPLYWTVAYKRATSQRISMRWYSRTLDRETPVSKAYTMLLRNGLPTSQNLRVVQLGDRQDLLASVIFQWKLPMAQSLGDLDPLVWRLVTRVPFQDQLDAIRRAVPRHELDIQHLCHSDFMYKACFWAGINCILGKLPRLVEECLDRVYRQLRRHEREGVGEYASVSPVLPFRWAFEEFEDTPFYHDRYWEYDPSIARFRSARRGWWTRRYHLWNHIQPDTLATMTFMDRSDLIAIELMQQRQWHRQLEDMLQPPPLAPHARLDNNGRDGDVRQVLESASRAGVWVTSDVLDLVRNLVECGDRCSRYQDAAEGIATAGYQEHVEDLTFELFSAAIRLALVLEGDDQKIDFEKLAQPIQLLTTVEQAIEDKLAAMQSDMICDIQASIKKEFTHLMEETWKDLEQKVRDEVQRKVAGAVTNPDQTIL